MNKRLRDRLKDRLNLENYDVEIKTNTCFAVAEKQLESEEFQEEISRIRKKQAKDWQKVKDKPFP